jgi:hypothetical protein
MWSTGRPWSLLLGKSLIIRVFGRGASRELDGSRSVWHNVWHGREEDDDLPAGPSEAEDRADVIRDAVSKVLEEERTFPEPRLPLGAFTLGAPDVAKRAEELLDGFGR